MIIKEYSIITVTFLNTRTNLLCLPLSQCTDWLRNAEKREKMSTSLDKRYSMESTKYRLEKYYCKWFLRRVSINKRTVADQKQNFQLLKNGTYFVIPISNSVSYVTKCEMIVRTVLVDNTLEDSVSINET